jgi:phosphoribosylformylglycinamidine synthase
MTGKAKVCVMYGDGINCDNETLEAFRLAGGTPRKALISDVEDKTVNLEDYHILAFPGGFSAADYLGAGKYYAIKAKALIGDEIMRFVEDGKLIVGICNGFQILTNYPLLPSPTGDRSISVTHNESARFEDRWVHLKMNKDSPCVFTKGIDTMHLPCRHGEGRVAVSNGKALEALRGSGQVVAWYSHEDGTKANGDYPANPNGSVEDIAGVCDKSGKIFGWMPHPEAFLHFTNDPDWTLKREMLRRKGKDIPEVGEGLRVFKNAVDFVEKEF